MPRKTQQEADELEGVESEEEPVVELPDMTVECQIVSFAAVGAGKDDRIKLVASSTNDEDIIMTLAKLQEHQVRLVEPPRQIGRPDTEMFGEMMDFKVITKGKKRIIIHIQFDYQSDILQKLDILYRTTPALFWMMETQRELELEVTEAG